MVCYYRDEKATADTLKDGWLFTGDMAMEDEDGFIYLVDRKKDVIITGGENLYPVQIENFLAAHQKIMDVAVIGLPDSRLGEIATAIIQIKDGMTCSEEEINEFINESIGGDLLNQLSVTNYNAKDYDLPFLGLYSACSTFTESLIVGSNFLQNNSFKKALIITSSHNLCAERQFRYPIEYGFSKPL